MTDQTDGFVRVHAEADVFERVERFDRSERGWSMRSFRTGGARDGS